MKFGRASVKKNGILHPALAQAVASLGHGDFLVIADAGLPIPDGPLRIDLVYSPGKPPFFDILQVVLQELQVEGFIFAQEIKEKSSEFHQLILEFLKSVTDAEAEYVAHEQFKALTRQAKVVVRTGEFTPYANIILKGGVVF